MSSVSSVTGNSGTQTDTDPAASIPAPKKTLGQDDFLVLLAKQFQTQDPMKPMDDTSFIAQMAQFTSLQQSSEMAKNLGEMKSQQELVAANSYLGHRVTVETGKGTTLSGDVSGVEITDGTPRLVIGEYTYPISAVLLVEPGAVTSSMPAATPGQ